MAWILLIETDEVVACEVAEGLRAFGHLVTTVTPEGALEALAALATDLVLVGSLSSIEDGLDQIGRVREASDAPIVMLSGRDAVWVKVAALRAGADDHVTRPFALPELDARIRAVLRRCSGSKASLLRFGEVEVDLSRRLVRVGGRRVGLTKTEHDLLAALCTNPGKLLAHRWLLSRVWGGARVDKTPLLRVYVGQLRQKLGDDADDPRLIATETGAGYRWIPEPD